jgi:hypothetical protein
MTTPDRLLVAALAAPIPLIAFLAILAAERIASWRK